MRLNDARNNTHVVDDVLQKYWPALQRKQMISPNGLFVDALSVKQSIPRQARDVAFTAWYGTKSLFRTLLTGAGLVLS